MVSVNTVDKYIETYKLYQKSLAETKIIDYCVGQLERNLTPEDLPKLISVVPPKVYQRILSRVSPVSDLPWEV
jgi:hypothetical protein